MTDEYILMVMMMGLVTFIPRWAPFFFLSNRKLPAWLVEWLDLIPAAILSALLIPSLITTGEPRRMILLCPELLAAIPTFIFALKTRSLGGTVIVGMAMFWLAGKLF
jgi:branched-subunit amino acid transport protein